MQDANGVGKVITKDFDDVIVRSTLEIHLYWTGKGTNAIPDRGVYGPLISAISVTPNFNTGRGLPVGAVIGTVLALIVVVLILLFSLWKKGIFGGKINEEELGSLFLDFATFA